VRREAAETAEAEKPSRPGALSRRASEASKAGGGRLGHSEGRQVTEKNGLSKVCRQPWVPRRKGRQVSLAAWAEIRRGCRAAKLGKQFRRPRQPREAGSERPKQLRHKGSRGGQGWQGT
jgi:hypothetical protein